MVTGHPERPARARADHPAAKVLDRADRLWERSDECDLAVVATPNRTHVQTAAAALEAGLPVVVDKPLAATSAEGRWLVSMAADRGVPLTVFHNRRWDGDFLTV